MDELHRKVSKVQRTISVPGTLGQARKFVRQEEKQAAIDPQTPSTAQEKEVDPSRIENPLTQKLLEEQLPVLQERYKEQRKSLELAILQQPMRIESGQLIVEVMGHVQEEIAEKMKPDLVSFFKEKTNLSKIPIVLEVKEEIEEHAQRLYTDRDKYDFLIQKNPAFKELAKKFGLETDF